MREQQIADVLSELIVSHPIIEDLNKRYTVKQYDASKRISADDLATIFEALRLSASSINSQPAEICGC